MKTYQAHETQAVVQPDGSIRVEGVPFAVGELIQVVLLSPAVPGQRRHSAQEVDRSRLIRSGGRDGPTTRAGDALD